jgi:DNA-binding MarR family transcriptional regulator
MHLTPKQLEVLRIIAKGNHDGSVADLDEIIERCEYKPTKQAIQFTIRALVKHELIEKLGSEKRRGRLRVLIGATVLGQHHANAGVLSVAAAIIESPEIDLG